MRRLVAAAALSAAIACARSGPLAAPPSSAACRDVVPDRHQTLTWIAPGDSHSRERLAAWCEAVGPVVFRPQPAAPGPPITDRLIVVSWNTHVGGGDVAGLVAAIKRGDFTGGEPVAAMVMLLQEAYRHSDLVPAQVTVHAAIPGRIIEGSHQSHDRDVDRIAQEIGLSLLYVPSMRNGLAPDDPEDRGNAILSTLPLNRPEVIELPIERQRRAVAVATIAIGESMSPGRCVSVANVHLDTALALTHGGPLRARSRQADALVDAFSHSDCDATIVAGDFNTFLGTREPAVKRLRRAFGDGPPPDNSATWRGPLGLRAPLDHVFARGRLTSMRVWRLPSRFGSDHYPLMADVRF